MKYFLFKSFFSTTYFLSCSIVTYGVWTLENLAVKIVLSIFMLLFCLYLTAVVAMKTGDDALRVRHANDLDRREIIRTGKEIPLKLAEEYKVWKGFLMGFLVTLPVILAMLVHTFIVAFGGGANMLFGKLTNLFNMLFYWVINLFYQVETLGTVYFNLIFIVIYALWFGLFYWLGAKKIMLQYDRIKEKHRQIYGDEEI